MRDVPVTVDNTVASVARAYDYALGGRDNFEVDRAFVRELTTIEPGLIHCARQNRDFGRRVADVLTRRGIRQFLDLGSGIPTSPPSIHETARAIDPDVRVVYVDNDPVVASHNRALRASDDGLVALEADFSNAERLFDHDEIRSTFDLGQPIGVLMLSVLQNTVQDQDAQALTAGIRKHLAPGSCLAISHISDEGAAPDIAEQITALTIRFGYPRTVLRSGERFKALFDGFNLLEPGVVELRHWRPDQETPTSPGGLRFDAAVGELH